MREAVVAAFGESDECCVPRNALLPTFLPTPPNNAQRFASWAYIAPIVIIGILLAVSVKGSSK
jgi:hypothetical protein